MKIKKRMHQPEDVLAKRTTTYLGDVLHEYHQLPGEYDGPVANDYPDKDGRKLMVNGAYYAKDGEEKFVIDIEDESSKVGKEELEKSYKYNVNIEYATKVPVYSVITTPLPLEKCETTYERYNFLRFTPLIISFAEMDKTKKLNTIEKKINNQEVFSAVEAFDVIYLTRMFQDNHREILEKSCELFSKMIVPDPFLRFELAKCMECVIHKYAKNLKEINRLVEMIQMTKIINAREEILNQACKQSKEEGKLEGKLEIAQKFAQKYDIDEVAEISGLSKDQILNGFASK